MSVSEVITEVEKYSTRNICITGGEPLLQKGVMVLMDILLKKKYHIVLETNGSISLASLPKSSSLLISMDVKCPSSKMQDEMDMNNIKFLKKGDQLKFVVADAADFDYAAKTIEKYRPKCTVVFQSVGGKELAFLAGKVLSKEFSDVLQHTEVRVLPQLHKVIWKNKRKGHY